MSEQKQSAWESRRGAFTRSIVGAAGALLYRTMSLVWPKPDPRSVLDPGPGSAPGIVGWSFRLFHFARELLCTAGYLRRLRFARGIQTKTAGCVDFCVPVGLGFPGALYLSLAKVGHERMSRNSRTKLGHHKFNSPETSLCGNAATKSTRKVLKSSPWARHSSMVRPGHIGVPDTWVTLLAQKGCREFAGFFPPGRCSQWSGPETWGYTTYLVRSGDILYRTFLRHSLHLGQTSLQRTNMR